jgi:phosphoribosyl 1,2-cyclic phosphate phosphodiesterase
MQTLRVTFLGTGTSQGVPRIGCGCPVCVSPDPRDKRTRCSLYIESPALNWVVDTGADFRSQCLREGVRKVDAVLYTHAHTDHVLGFDDLRPFCQPNRPLPIYGSAATLESLASIFAFAFNPTVRVPGYVYPLPNVIDGEFDLGGLRVLPLDLPHGRVTSTGYLFSRGDTPLLAYLTDCKTVPSEVEKAVAGVKHLVLDALRKRPHPTHMSIGEALEVVERVGAESVWLTHLCHEHSHGELEGELPIGVRVAYDGLTLEV